MALRTLEKQPAESRLFDIDFDALLAAGETISSITSFVATPTTAPDLTMTSINVTVSGKRVQFRAAAGTDNTAYKITAIVLTTLGNTLEADVRLNVYSE